MPRVFIFGQPFNDFSGGGITLSNLFRGWRKEDLAVAYMGFGLYSFTTDICDTYYQLGVEEYKWLFPFNKMQRQFPSGLKSIVKDDESKEPVYYIQKGLRYKIVTEYFYPFLHWTGMYHFLTRLVISDRLKSWFEEYKPEILYLQVSSRDEINFALELINYLKVPSVIHMMDDWPKTLIEAGIFKKQLQNKIDREFKILLDKVDLHLSISDAMSEEYKKRYGKEFTAFHNPIDMKAWLPDSKKDYELNADHVTVLYSGRIGMGIMESLYEVADAIDTINETGTNIKLHIQTPTKKAEIIDKLLGYKCVIINPFAAYEDLPKIFSQADILLMANDFDRSGMDFLRFSMPTKASEFMISGAPILVYAPEGAALTDFLNKNECAYCITNQDKGEIIKGIRFLLENKDFRISIGQKAFSVAKERFSTDVVRPKFQGMITDLAKQNKNTMFENIHADKTLS